MNDSTDISYGQYIKQGREEKKFTIFQLSQKTKISVKILDALENEKFEGLPQKSYLIGFTRTYAREVGLPADKCIELLDLALNKSGLNKPFYPLDANSKGPDKPRPKNTEQDVKDIDALQDVQPYAFQIPTKGILVTISGLLVVGIIVYAIIAQINTSSEKITLAPPATDNVALAQASVIPQEAAQVVDHGSVVEILPTQIPTLVQTPSTVPSPVPTVMAQKIKQVTPMNLVSLAAAQATGTAIQGLKYDKIFFYRKLTPPLYSLSPLTGDGTNEIYPPSARNTNQGSTNRLYIHATKGDCWITYKVDNNVIKATNLKMGNVLDLPAQQVILIFMGNAQNLSLIFNDQLVDFNSPKGFKSLVFPESQITNYSLPLFVTEDDGKIYTASEYAKLASEEFSN